MNLIQEQQERVDAEGPANIEEDNDDHFDVGDDREPIIRNTFADDQPTFRSSTQRGNVHTQNIKMETNLIISSYLAQDIMNIQRHNCV